MTDVTIVTCQKHLLPSTADDYTKNIFIEYKLLKHALEAKGLTVKRTFWDDPNCNWGQTKVAVIRTVWDYFERFDEFKQWMLQTAAVTNLINPLPLQQWNSHKFYLRDLAERGVDVVPTEFIKKGSKITLQEISANRNWSAMVMKPAISAAAFHTYKIPASPAGRSATTIHEMEAKFQELLASRDMLLQPFVETITKRGEASLMVFNEKYTHAILKKAKQGDFRVQDDFGGTVHDYEPTEKEIQFAEFANAQCPTKPVYGRVDIVWDSDGNPMLSEMEFLDPEIWLRNCPTSAEKIAEGIVKYLDSPFDLPPTNEARI